MPGPPEKSGSPPTTKTLGKRNRLCGEYAVRIERAAHSLRRKSNGFVVALCPENHLFVFFRCFLLIPPRARMSNIHTTYYIVCGTGAMAFAEL